MKNLVFVIADLGMGGAQRVLSVLLNDLAAQGRYKIDVITVSRQQPPCFFPLPATVKIHHAGDSIASGNAALALFANVQRVRALRKTLKDLEPNLIISFLSEINCVCLLAAFGTGLPVVVSERSDPYRHPQSPLWRLIRRVLYPLAQGAVFQTEHASRFFAGMIKNRVVIFNPVNVDTDLSEPAPAGPYILGVGRLAEEKGFDDLIAAHAIARAKCPDLKLVLVGDGPDRKALEAQAGALNVSGSVLFAGSRNKLAPYYKNALAFVLPSHFEGLPNALLEALAYSCIPISTPLFAAAPEIISHGKDGLIAASGSPQALADQIIHIYENPEAAAVLRNNIPASAARFDKASVCSDWENYIKKWA